MSTEFVIERHMGGVDRLDRRELIAELTDDYRYDLQTGVDDQVNDFESLLSELSDVDLAKQHIERTGEMVRIEEREEER
jgi:hypothetical protein